MSCCCCCSLFFHVFVLFLFSDGWWSFLFTFIVWCYVVYELCCCRYLDDFTTHFSGFHLAHFNGCVEHTRWHPKQKNTITNKHFWKAYRLVRGNLCVYICFSIIFVCSDRKRELAASCTYCVWVCVFISVVWIYHTVYYEYCSLDGLTFWYRKMPYKWVSKLVSKQARTCTNTLYRHTHRERYVDRNLNKVTCLCSRVGAVLDAFTLSHYKHILYMIHAIVEWSIFENIQTRKTITVSIIQN